VLYWPQTNLVYVGSANGRLYELDFTSANQATSAPPWAWPSWPSPCTTSSPRRRTASSGMSGTRW